MSRFTLVLNEPSRLDDISKDEDVVEKPEKSNFCFVCSKPITESEQVTSNVRRKDRTLVPVLFQMLTDGRSTCDTDVDLLIREQEEENSPVNFCSPCRIYLRLWHDLMTSIIPILEKSNQIKFTIIANLLSSSRRQQSQPAPSAVTGRASLTESRDLASFLQTRLDGITKKLLNDYSPKIILERLEPPSAPVLPNVGHDKELALGANAIGEADLFDLNDMEIATDCWDTDDNRGDPGPVDNSDETMELDPDVEIANNHLSSAQTQTHADIDSSHSCDQLPPMNSFLPKKSPTWMCDICGNTLKTEQTLRRHKLRIHSAEGANNLVCQYCGKVFKEDRYFECHVAIHEKGEEAKKFQCEYCGKRFGIGRECRKHVRRVHTKETLFNCLHCELKFTNQVLVHKHRFSVHGILPPKMKKKLGLDGIVETNNK